LHRLTADLVSRHVGMLLTSILAAIVLPFWIVFFCYIATILAEIAQHRLLVALVAEPTRLRHMLFLLLSALGIVFYLVPPALVWWMEEPLLMFAAMLAVIGALLNASVVRSAHLPAGLAAALPPAILALWMPLSRMGSESSTVNSIVALAGVIALLGYFLSAMLQNNRVQHELARVADSARAASEAKSHFLAAMNHEVRTPLNALLGHSQLLREAKSPEAARAHAAEIEHAARGLETLVEDVVDLSAAAEGKLHFQPATVSIRAEVARIAGHLTPRADGTVPSVHTEIADEVPEFGRFDPVLLRKSLVHLATIALSEQENARQPELNIRCALAPGRIDRLRFTLAASEPGAKLTATGDRLKVEGLDGDTIGLALVNSAAVVMGANTAVLRAPDQTLVTRIELPFVSVPEPPATGAENVYGRLRTLVVDDISSNRLVVAQMLRSLRIEATEAASGPEALDRLHDADYDLVLLDMNMPDMDGEATLQSIRASGKPWANLPVVALTADTLGGQRDHYLGIGLNGFLSKPLDRRVLWSEILSACPPPPPL
jgi:two-component system, sensor histidine kinase